MKQTGGEGESQCHVKKTVRVATISGGVGGPDVSLASSPCHKSEMDQTLSCTRLPGSSGERGREADSDRERRGYAPLPPFPQTLPHSPVCDRTSEESERDLGPL